MGSWSQVSWNEEKVPGLNPAAVWFDGKLAVESQSWFRVPRTYLAYSEVEMISGNSVHVASTPLFSSLSVLAVNDCWCVLWASLSCRAYLLGFDLLLQMCIFYHFIVYGFGTSTLVVHCPYFCFVYWRCFDPLVAKHHTYTYTHTHIHAHILYIKNSSSKKYWVFDVHIPSSYHKLMHVLQFM